MHGFFMDTNLYNRVKAVANPFEYEDYKKKELKERLEAKRSRDTDTLSVRLPTVIRCPVWT